MAVNLSYANPEQLVFGRWSLADSETAASNEWSSKFPADKAT